MDPVMDFRSFRCWLEHCKKAAETTFKMLLLSNKPEITGFMKKASLPVRHCFRIPMGNQDCPFTHVSVSIPPDLIPPDQDGSKVPECIETALVGPNGKLVYINGLRYHNVRRFIGITYLEAIPDLEAEILRLLAYARGEKKIPEEYPGSESEEYPSSESEEEIEEAEPIEV